MAGAIGLLGVGAAPYDRAHLLTGAAISLGASGSGPTIAGAQLVDRSDPRIAVLGGETGVFGDGWPRLLFTTTATVTDGSAERQGAGGKLVFRTNAAAFDLRIYATGPSANLSLVVDGQLAATAQPAIPADGSLRWLHFQLPPVGRAGTRRTVEIEFQGGANLGGLALPPQASIAPPVIAAPRIVFLGDSFTEGVGAAAPGEDWVSIVAHRLGLTDAWQSGLGSTGYARAWLDRPALVDRIAADGVAAQGDIYVIAMGLNDGAAVLGEASAVFSALTTARPGARIFALTSFNPAAPGLDTMRPQVDADIRAAAARFPQVTVIDVSPLAFSKLDGTHPDAAGHWTIADFVASEIARALGADGAIARNARGDAVGPLWIENYDPAVSHTFSVLENGAPSSRFTVIENGSEFPVLQLLAGQAVRKAGAIELTIIAQGDDGSNAQGVVQFAVTAPVGRSRAGADFAPELVAATHVEPLHPFDSGHAGGWFA